MPRDEQTVTRVIAALNKANSRSSRTHIQKMLFFAQSWLKMPTRFRFVMYLHGPYSFALDQLLLEMEALGGASRTPSPDGYGSRYEVSASDVPADLMRLAEWLGPMTVKEIEARATAEFFLARRSDDIGRDVQAAKPHLGSGEIDAACADVRRIRAKYGGSAF